MGMGYSGCYADVVDQSFVEEVAPAELENFLNTLEKSDVEVAEFARESQYGGGDWDEPVGDAYDALTEKFKSETGLELEIAYHSSEDEGSRYDDVDGVFWVVGGVYMKTPAGEKYKNRITRAFYVTFG